MAFLFVATLAYVVIMVCAMALTLNEFLSSKDSTWGFFTLGLLACAAWPVTLVSVVIAAQFKPVLVYHEAV